MGIKLAFFDIDGTLSVPRYKTNNQYVIGFSDEEWKKYCEKNKENAYSYCLVVEPIKRYAQELKENGVGLYVLSTSNLIDETNAKHKFINDNFSNLFNDILIVKKDDEKIKTIKEIANKHNVSLSECELVEDTYATLLKAATHSIKATHISNIIYNL